MKRLYDFLISLWTLVGVFAVLLLLFLFGSISLPTHLAFFSGIDDAPLFSWLAESGKPAVVWWIWAIVAGLGVMGLSTVLCTLDFFLHRMSRTRFLQRVSPQVMHIGALLVMLGHLLTASSGFKKDVALKDGERVEVDQGVVLALERMDLVLDEYGLATDWSARILLDREGRPGRPHSIRPAGPVYDAGLGIYFKSVSLEKPPAAVFRVCRDHGAPWALAGGLLLVLGGAGFLVGRMQAERGRPETRADAEAG